MIGGIEQGDAQPAIIMDRVLRNGVIERVVLEIYPVVVAIGNYIVRPDLGIRRLVARNPITIVQRLRAARVGTDIISFHFVAGRVNGSVSTRNAHCVTVTGDHVPFSGYPSDLKAQTTVELDPLIVPRPARVGPDIVPFNFIGGTPDKPHAIKVAGDHVPLTALTAPDLIARGTDHHRTIKIAGAGNPIAVPHRPGPRRVQADVVPIHFIAGGIATKVYPGGSVAGDHVPFTGHTAPNFIARAAVNIDPIGVGIRRGAVSRRTEITAKYHIVRLGAEINGGVEMIDNQALHRAIIGGDRKCVGRRGDR